MSKTISNEPAYPIKEVGVTVTNGGKDFYISGDLSRSDFETTFGGLTKREYFAAMALQGSVSAQSMSHPDWIKNEVAESHAKKAVMLADALIEALNKGKL